MKLGPKRCYEAHQEWKHSAPALGFGRTLLELLATILYEHIGWFPVLDLLLVKSNVDIVAIELKILRVPEISKLQLVFHVASIFD